MIITKSGRRMFPTLRLRFNGTSKNISILNWRPNPNPVNYTNFGVKNQQFVISDWFHFVTNMRRQSFIFDFFSGLAESSKYHIAVDIIPKDKYRYRYTYHRSCWTICANGKVYGIPSRVVVQWYLFQLMYHQNLACTFIRRALSGVVNWTKFPFLLKKWNYRILQADPMEKL